MPGGSVTEILTATIAKLVAAIQDAAHRPSIGLNTGTLFDDSAIHLVDALQRYAAIFHKGAEQRVLPAESAEQRVPPSKSNGHSEEARSMANHMAPAKDGEPNSASTTTVQSKENSKI